MSVEVQEKFKSPRLKVGASPNVDVHYLVDGTDDHGEAYAAVEAAAAMLFDLFGTGVFLLSRSTIALEPVGPDSWEAVAHYGTSGARTSPQPDQPVTSFDTTGGTQHITQSLATVQKRAASGQTAPDFKGAIGVVQGGGVEGVDIPVSSFRFTETHYFTDEQVTNAFKGILARLSGCTNDAPFKGFAAGEVLFHGAIGSQRGDGSWEIQFQFSANPNQTNLSAGDITGIEKKGWQYLWFAYQEQEDSAAQANVQVPLASYVEQVLPEDDFTQLGIGT